MNWELAEFNQKLGEIAAHAHGCGPQRVKLNGNVEVIVLSPAEYARLSAGLLSAKPPEAGIGHGVHWIDEMRRPFEEAAARGEEMYWPWDWDCETREWIAPVDDAVPS